MTPASAPTSRCSACAEVAGQVAAPGGVARNLFRKVGVLRNPTAEARGEAAVRVRQAWEQGT